MKHFTLESASLHSIPGRKVVNSQTFYFSILQTILKHFQRSFVERHSIMRALYSIHNLFLQLSYIRHIFYTFHPIPFEICIYIYIYIYSARAEYFLIPDDAVDRRKLGLWILITFLNSSLRPHQNSFFYFRIMLLKDNKNRLLKLKVLYGGALVFAKERSTYDCHNISQCIHTPYT